MYLNKSLTSCLKNNPVANTTTNNKEYFTSTLPIKSVTIALAVIAITEKTYIYTIPPHDSVFHQGMFLESWKL